MPNKHNGSNWGLDVRVTQELFHKRLSKCMDIEGILGPVGPVRIVAKAMDSDSLEVCILREPLSGPEDLGVLLDTPGCLGTASEAVNKNKVCDDGSGRIWLVGSVETKRVSDFCRRLVRGIAIER